MDGGSPVARQISRKLSSGRAGPNALRTRSKRSMSDSPDAEFATATLPFPAVRVPRAAMRPV